MVKWKFGLNLEILETWTEFLVHFSFLKWIWNSIVQCFVVTKVIGWVFVGLWWLPYSYIYTFYTPGRKCLRGGRRRQVLGFAHLLHATFGRPLNSVKNASKRIKLPSLDLPVTSVTVGRHLERRRALCRCGSRSRGSRGRRKAPFPQGEAGRRMAPRWCRCLRDTESNISKPAVIPNDKIMLTEHCNNIGHFYAFLSLAYVVVQHEQIIFNSFDCKIMEILGVTNL